jgi:hypothetical protein
MVIGCSLAVNAPYGTDPAQVSGVGTEGVTCDFCHKIWDARLNPNTGLPYPNMPSVLSLEFRRPTATNSSPGRMMMSGSRAAKTPTYRCRPRAPSAPRAILGHFGIPPSTIRLANGWTARIAIPSPAGRARTATCRRWARLASRITSRPGTAIRRPSSVTGCRAQPTKNCCTIPPS